jgi:uncharacterized protein
MVARRPKWGVLAPAAVLLAVLLSATAWSQVPSDALLARLEPTGRVNDFAQLLGDADSQALEDRLKDVEEKTSAQIAVVTLTSLEGGEINDFANKLFRKWGIGQKGRDNGVLVLVARDDRRARVEVGRGLEPVLPDVLAGRVLDEEMFPAFRQGNYAEGLRRGVLRVADIVEKNEPAPREALAPRRRGDWGGTFVWFLFFGGFGGLMMGGGVGSRSLGPGLMGALLSAIGLAIVYAMLGATGLAVGLAVVAIAFVFGFVGARKDPKRWRRGSGRSNPGGWVWTSPNWGGSSGGGFDWGGSSGGFSGFGGGDSGGGGASGGW